MNHELPDVQAGLEKAEESEIKLPTSIGSQEKSNRVPENICFIDYTKVFDIVNKAEIDVFLELSCFFDDPTDVDKMISGSSAFSNPA